jgi:hypothetical protein
LFQFSSFGDFSFALNLILQYHCNIAQRGKKGIGNSLRPAKSRAVTFPEGTQFQFIAKIPVSGG